MRVFVTGGTGFIGQHLVHRLVGLGHAVVALVRNPARASVLPPEVSLLPGDLAAFRDPVFSLPACDVVVHLAGATTAPDAAAYRAANHDAALDLVGCLARQPWRPRRLLFASSLAATGPTTPDHPKSEDDADHPIDAYGVAKKDAEVWLATHAPFPTTSFRPPMVIGPHDPATFTLFRMARRGVGFRTWQDQIVSWIDVDDLVDALVAMALDERPGHRVYYASHPEPVRTSAMWASLGRAFDRRLLVVPVPAPAMWAASAVATLGSRVTGWTNQLDAKMTAQMVAPAFTCTSARLTTELGWTARNDLDTTLARTARAWVDSGRL